MLMACLQKGFAVPFQFVCDYYLNPDILKAQLFIIGVNFQSTIEGEMTSTTIFDIVDYFTALSVPQ